MTNMLSKEKEVVIINRIKELLQEVKIDASNFLIIGIGFFDNKETIVKTSNQSQIGLVSADINNDSGVKDEIVSLKLKGRFFKNITYDDLIKTSFSDHFSTTKEISLKDITLIQSFNHIRRNTILLKFKQQNSFFVTSSSIEKILKIMPSNFIQVHQSFIVNRHYITKQNGRCIVVENEKIPIGRSFKNAIIHLS